MICEHINKDGKCKNEATHKPYFDAAKFYCDTHGVNPLDRAVILLLPKITNNEYPLILGVSRKHNHNDWGLPGGKVEKEDHCDFCAVKREVLEECGLKVTGLVPIFTYYNVSSGKSVTTFTGQSYGYNLKTKESGLCKWITPNKVLGGTFGVYNKRLFKFIGWDY